jgi:hypothetical protein
MLRFDVYRDGKPADDVDLAGAYVFGQDAIPVRADLATSDSQISCIKRIPGACGLALLWNAGESGRYLLPTTRLPEQSKPYNLNVELARAQMMRIGQKREDWGLFDFTDAKTINREYRAAMKMFTESLKATDPGQAAVEADKALAAGLTLGEKIALFHAEIFLSRRKAAVGGAAPRTPFGCSAELFDVPEGYRERLRETFDFANIRIPWKHTEPKERTYDFSHVDQWVNWAARARKPLHAGPLLSFAPTDLPEWLYIWEHDYETLRDLIYEHIQRVVQRYDKHVRLWNVVSGIHAYNSFNLSFEQIMELTRMSCLLVKKLVPNAQVMIELAMPWGEYYSRNQRTIPPLLYADMAVQSGIKFDAFGIQLGMGVPVDGYYIRDLLQVSSLLDEFVGFGKTVQVTACEVPSDTTMDTSDAWGGKAQVLKAGHWHTPWSQRLQAEWLQAFYRIAISKPFVESVCWRDLADSEGHYIPHGGLCTSTMEPKLSYKELRNFRAYLASGGSETKKKKPAGKTAPRSKPKGNGAT